VLEGPFHSSHAIFTLHTAHKDHLTYTLVNGTKLTSYLAPSVKFSPTVNRLGTPCSTHSFGVNPKRTMMKFGKKNLKTSEYFVVQTVF